MKNLVEKLRLKEIALGSFLFVLIGFSFYNKNIQASEEKKEKNLLDKYKFSLINYIDENDTLSKYEQFRIDSFCEILDKPKNYDLTFEDWKKGYDNLPEKFK